MSTCSLETRDLSPSSGERVRRHEPTLRTGIGLRAQHQREILERKPAIPWLEGHSENYFAPGGWQRDELTRIRADYALSLHGVGLSIGSMDPLDANHLRELTRLIRELEPMLVSEHLSWGSIGGRFTNDLLPLPYTEEALRHMTGRVREVQDRLGRQILIENVSSYLQFTCSRVPEWEFLSALAAQSGCGILLDINNIYVSARNHGFDPCVYLAGIPTQAVQEIHLAGHTVNRAGSREIRIDTHSAPVCSDVWELYRTALRRFGPVPTLIEWDAEIPALEVLMAEAAKADLIQEALHVAAA